MGMARARHLAGTNGRDQNAISKRSRNRYRCRYWMRRALDLGVGRRPQWVTASANRKEVDKQYVNAEGADLAWSASSCFKTQVMRGVLRRVESRLPPPMRRPSSPVLALNAAILVSAAVFSVLTSPDANWDLLTLGLLLGLAIVSDLMAASIRSSKLKVSGSFLAIVVAMVLLGGAPAALVGVLTITAGWLKWREKPHYLLANLASYAAFPLACGLLFDLIRDHYQLDSGDTGFPVLVFGTFVLALAVNFTMAALYTRHMDGSRVALTARRALVPLLISDMVAALMAVGVSEVTLHLGSGALALFGVLLLAFQRLLAALLTSEDRAEDLQRRTEQLASLQVGLLSAMLRTLDLRDRMTARHSAAVARYAREIAKAA